MDSLSTISNVVTTAAQIIQSNKNDNDENNTGFQVKDYIEEYDGLTVNSSDLGNENTDVADAFKRQASGYSPIREIALATEEDIAVEE